VNSLPKTVTRQRRGCNLNPGTSAPESSTLTTRLPSHPHRISTKHKLYMLLCKFIDVTYTTPAHRPASLHTSCTNRFNPGNNGRIRNVPVPATVCSFVGPVRVFRRWTSSQCGYNIDRRSVRGVSKSLLFCRISHGLCRHSVD